MYAVVVTKEKENNTELQIAKKITQLDNAMHRGTVAAAAAAAAGSGSDNDSGGHADNNHMRRLTGDCSGVRNS